MSKAARLSKALLEHALRLPEAYADHPWGETVAKVGKKIFAFFGGPDGTSLTVKLVESQPFALAVPGAAPTGYGLGKSGWVTIPLAAAPPAGVLRDWIEESYRVVAPKKLAAQLDACRPD
jgi:predicted DNA-binding protein (MmcQ/YjbR family)